MATGPSAATNQFGNVASVHGFFPLGTTGPSPIPTSDRIPVSASSALILKRNSPVKVIAGAVLSAVQGDSEKVAGVVMEMFDSAGNVVYSIPATPTLADYYVTITTDPNQVFVALVNTNAYAETNIGVFYNISAADAAVAGTDKFFAPGYGYSARYLDGSTEATSGKQFRVLGRAKYERNDAASSSGTLVYCVINPSNYSPGEAS